MVKVPYFLIIDVFSPDDIIIQDLAIIFSVQTARFYFHIIPQRTLLTIYQTELTRMSMGISFSENGDAR